MFEDKWDVIRDKTAVEAGYVNNPKDLGGPTNFGITQTTAGEWKHLWSKYNWDGNMQTMPKQLAFEIYDLGWWSRLRLDDVWKLSIPLAERIFDFGINAGRGNAGRSLQEILNVLNKEQKLWPDIAMDGAVGQKTIDALKAYVNANRRDPEAIEKLTMMMFSAQNYHYVQISLKRAANEEFTNGWMNRVWRDFKLYAEWLMNK
jgi:lysozyme family protein